MILCVLIFLFFFSSMTHGEIIVLQSGQKIQGKIVDQDQESLRLDVGLSIPLTYFFHEIKQILPDPPKLKPKAKFKKQGLTHDQIKQLENRAADFIKEGDVSQGLALMKQILLEQPTAMRHLNYASVLFGQGVMEFKNDPNSIEILQQAEKELRAAIKDFDVTKEARFLAQAYFLLGEIYFNAYSNQDQAVTYYLKALSFYDHPAAKEALGRLR